MAKPSTATFVIDLKTAAGLAALATYAKKLEVEDPAKAVEAHDLLDDIRHEAAKALRREKLKTTPTKANTLPILEMPVFASEKEEADWWDANPEKALEIMKNAAAEGRLTHGTLAKRYAEATAREPQTEEHAGDPFFVKATDETEVPSKVEAASLE